MTELPAASVHQDSSEADLVQLLDAWSQGWKRKGRVRAVGPGAYEKYCTLGLYAHGGVSGITQASNDEDACALFATVIWLAFQPDWETTLRLLELFSGTGWAGPSGSWEPTICADVCSWKPMPMFAPGYFDMIWALPPCTEYSRALTRRPRRLEEGDRTAIRTLELIRDLRPRFL